MKTKYFHIFHDGRTVKEIDRFAFQEMLQSPRNYKLATVHEGEIMLFYNEHRMHLYRKQLEQVTGSWYDD